MAKNLKLNIKNAQLAEAINLKKIKKNLGNKKPTGKKEETPEKKAEKPVNTPTIEALEETRKVKARTRSVFEESPKELQKQPPLIEEKREAPSSFKEEEPSKKEEEPPKEEAKEESVVSEKPKEEIKKELPPATPSKPVSVPPPQIHSRTGSANKRPPSLRLGPTGRHINDILPKKRIPKKEPEKPSRTSSSSSSAAPKKKVPPVSPEDLLQASQKADNKKKASHQTFPDNKSAPAYRRKGKASDRQQSLHKMGEETTRWRKRRAPKSLKQEIVTIRPSELTVRMPLTIKDLATAMKVKASQLIQKLFLQGSVYTLNDLLEDETTIQLLGHEFECEITIDTSEEERIRVTGQTIREEIKETASKHLTFRPPVVTFMGHVDHGKTSLIDAIRKSNLTAHEAGAITQHIGAFYCETPNGNLAILDTPGHEAFSAMRARGAEVTDIVVLVIAGDEGMRQQTIEALQHAKAAKVSIIVALNKCDKPNFDAEKVYRQLADNELLPEAWGGQTVTVNCSAITNEGIPELLEMLALQSEVLELKANPSSRARGSVIESEMHKGMGAIATLLVQNGTLRKGDAIVFGAEWGQVRTMKDQNGKNISEASPSTPVEITGLSGLSEAGEEFVVVSNPKEAKEIAKVRTSQKKESSLLMKKRVSLETLLQTTADNQSKKTLNIILRADAQGSLEALKTALEKIDSDKVNINIIFTGVGEVSESDVQLAAASLAIILGFHTHVESHAESLIREAGVIIEMHDVIYNILDAVKKAMTGLLDQLAKEEDRGKAEVRATFKVSQLGVIAGCFILDGTIHRNHRMRVIRKGEVIWIGSIASLKRNKDDVKEVSKEFECGILLKDFNAFEEGDILQSYEVVYYSQEL